MSEGLVQCIICDANFEGTWKDDLCPGCRNKRQQWLEENKKEKFKRKNFQQCAAGPVKRYPELVGQVYGTWQQIRDEFFAKFSFTEQGLTHVGEYKRMLGLVVNRLHCHHQVMLMLRYFRPEFRQEHYLEYDPYTTKTFRRTYNYWSPLVYLTRLDQHTGDIILGMKKDKTLDEYLMKCIELVKQDISN